MKNLLEHKEFKKLKNLRLNENMDFSNRVGWSECLVGRLVNKFFSFVTKNIYIAILKRLKTELDNQYLKGILLAAQNIKEGSSALAAVDIVLVEKEDENNIIYPSETPSTNGIRMTYNFEIPKNSIEKFKAKITSDNNSTWVYKNEENPDFIEDLEENFSLEATAEDGVTKLEINVNISQTLPEMTEEEEETKELPSGSSDKEDSDVKYELMNKLDYNKQIKMIQRFVDRFDKNCVKENDYALMLRISDALNKESEQINKILSLVSKSEEISEDLVVYKENSDEYKKYADTLKELSGSLKDKAETIDSEKKSKKELSDEEINKILDNAGKIKEEECDKYLLEVNNLWEVLNKKLKDEEKKKKFKKLHNFVVKTLHPDTRKNYTDEERYIAYTNFKIFVNTINEAIYNNYDELLLEKAFYEFEKIYEKINLSKNLKMDKIKNLFTNKDKKKLDSKKLELINKYGNIDIDKIDIDNLIERFRKEPRLMTEAVNNVNKEALKEIALRAAWIYDRDKYQDENNRHYSRVNFTVTHTDAAKLKNTWLRLIAKSKATFAPFFSKDNNFPPQLDPIALMNSDENFRKNFSQYDKYEAEKNSNLTIGGSIFNINPELDNKLKIVSQKLSDQMYGLILFSPKKSDKNYVLVVQKIEKNNLHIFKYIGIYDFDKIQKEVANENNPNKIKEIIQKYNYSGSDLYTSKIKDKDELKFFKEMYDAFRPTKYNLFVSKTGYKDGTDKLGTFFILKENPSSSSKNMFQVNVIGDSNYNPKSSWICKINKNEWKIVDYINYEELKSMNEGEYNKYLFNFYFQDVFKIVDKDYWITKRMDISRDEKVTRMLTDDVLNTIQSIFKIKSK